MGMSSMVSPSVVSLEEAESQHLPGAGSVLSLEASFESRLVEVSLVLREGLSGLELGQGFSAQGRVRVRGLGGGWMRAPHSGGSDGNGVTRGGVGWGLDEGVQMGAQ